MSKSGAVPIHESLWRPVLLLGGERPVAILALVIPVYLMFILSVRFGLYIGVPVGVGLLTACLSGAVWMAKRDPQFTKVFRRALGYRGFYPATPHAHAEEKPWRSVLRAP